MSAVIHVLDDDPSMRRSLERLLRSHGWEVRPHASVREFRSADAARSVGCLLLDLRLGGAQSGLDLLEELQQDHSPLGVVLLSGYGDVPSTVRAMRYGAIDFLTKPVNEERLVEAVGQAAAQSHHRQERADEDRRLAARFDRLTPREKQVCALVARGLLNKQIADELGASEKTIKVHRGRVMAKLELRSVAELVRLVDRLRPAAD